MKKKFKPHKPTCLAGHLYYVRLKTEIGILYKLGFTTLQSVSERLNYQNIDGNYEIDEVLFFHHYENAWDIEQKLHHHFKKNSLFTGFDESMPLFKNGQSELYAKDILEIDVKYSEVQMEDVLINIEKVKLNQYNFFNEEKVTLVAEYMRERFDKKRADKMASIEYSKNFESRNKKLVAVLKFTFNFIFYFIDVTYKIARKFLSNQSSDNKNDDVKRMIEYIQDKAVEKRSEERILRQAKMNALLKEYQDKERLGKRI